MTGSAGSADPTPGPIAPLSQLVRQEAHRVLSEAQRAPDPARVAAGWERRFIADGTRVAEAVRLYRDLGFEVCADPLQPQALASGCEDCQLLMLLNFKAIYTRAPQGRR